MASFALVCALVAGCLATDGTTQPQGTVMQAPIAWDGVTAYSPPGMTVVPYSGQVPYAPPAPPAKPTAPTSVTVVSTEYPDLNASYGIAASDVVNITSVVAGVSAGQGFPGGASTLTWVDSTGAAHTFQTTAEFVAFGAAIESYVYSLQLIGLGQQATLPTTPLQIP